MSKSALASLTDQYTDSENEDEKMDEKSSDSQTSQASQVILPSTATNAQDPSPVPKAPPKIKKRSKAVRRLVSYQDDTLVSASSESSSSEEEEDETANQQDMQSPTNAATFPREVTKSPSAVEVLAATEAATKAEAIKEVKSVKYASYNFRLPPSPAKTKVATDLSEKVRNLYEKMETNHMDMNRIIQGRKEFRNPSIYEKLIHFCGINEFGTNYPPEIYDPLKWGAESYYEELARVQKNDMLKRQKERKEMDKIEQAIAVARKVEEDAKKRKSKWDQPATKVVVPPTLTTTVTGTKGTVISAFGSLPKKPAL